MKWKQGVKLIKDGKTYICMRDKKKEIPEDDILIAELLENGVNDDDRLVSEVSVYEDGDNIQARLRLAQFVEDFGDFIEDAVPSKLYE
ncbi:MAG: hypothetical protein J6P57_09780 [Lachnospiraceae bacterium]|nr:hypothetical protein [Lachnospiraceae bacterium]